MTEGHILGSWGFIGLMSGSLKSKGFRHAYVGFKSGVLGNRWPPAGVGEREHTGYKAWSGFRVQDLEYGLVVLELRLGMVVVRVRSALDTSDVDLCESLEDENVRTALRFITCNATGFGSGDVRWLCRFLCAGRGVLHEGIHHHGW